MSIDTARLRTMLHAARDADTSAWDTAIARIEFTDAMMRELPRLLDELERLRIGLLAINTYKNDGNPFAIDMQMIAAEIINPGRWATRPDLLAFLIDNCNYRGRK